MKSFSKLIVAAALSCCCALALAAVPAKAASVQVDLNSLTPELRQQVLEATQAQATVTKANPSQTVLAATREWADLGQSLGAGIVAAAKELGIAANDFAKSDLGKLVIVVLIWKFMGAQLISIVFGSVILVGGFSVGLWLVRKARNDVEKIEFAPFSYLFGLITIRRVIKSETRVSDRLSDSQISQQVFGYVVIAVSFIVGIVQIF